MHYTALLRSVPSNDATSRTNAKESNDKGLAVILEDVDNVIQHGGDDKIERSISIFLDYYLTPGSGMNNWFNFVIMPWASEPSKYFNISKLAYCYRSEAGVIVLGLGTLFLLFVLLYYQTISMWDFMRAATWPYCYIYLIKLLRKH